MVSMRAAYGKVKLIDPLAENVHSNHMHMIQKMVHEEFYEDFSFADRCTSRISFETIRNWKLQVYGF